MSSYTEQKEKWEQVRNTPHLKKVREGNYDPGPWLASEPGDGVWGQWGIKAKPGRRGLTFFELLAAGDEPPPDEGYDTPQIRGAGMDTRFPLGKMEYPANKKSQVWSQNVIGLYEEAVSRQWSAARDIPWDKLTPLSKEMEKSLCHICTLLTRIEIGGSDRLGPWIPKIGNAYQEVKMFLCTQIMDESRHMEVFRKRALANGGGMGATFGTSTSLDAYETDAMRNLFRDYNSASFLIHFSGEGMVLDIFRFAEFLGQTDVDKTIFQRVMQDEARHVSYGTMRLAYYLENAPDREDAILQLHHIADQVETRQTLFLLLNPHMLEAGAILAAGGTTNIERGYDAYRQIYLNAREEYLRRCDRVGFPRRDKCALPPEPPF